MPGGAGRSAGNYGGMGAGMAPGADAGAGSGSGGMTGGGMPEGFTLPEGFKMPTMVWVKDEKGIHPVWVEIGSNDGENAEVKSGLAEGDEVAIKMTVATSKDKKEKEVASNPFMPTPPGRRNSQGTSRSSAGSSTRN